MFGFEIFFSNQLTQALISVASYLKTTQNNNDSY